MRIWIALAAGILAIAAAVAASLAHAPLVVGSQNGSFTHETVAITVEPTGACQAGETVPAGTSAIRLGLTTVLGPAIWVKLKAGSRVLRSGAHAAGWEGASVTIPLAPVRRALAPVTVCFGLHDVNGPVTILGQLGKRHPATGFEGRPLPGRLHIEYLKPGPQTWWSMVSATAWRLGLGRAASGTWNAILALALAAALVVLSCGLLARDLR